MFVIPNIEEQLKGLDKHMLEIYDDASMQYMVSDQYKSQWDKIDKISIRNSYCTIDSIRELGKSPYGQKIKEIDMAMNFSTINDEFILEMVQSKYLNNIEALDLADDDITDQAIRHMAYSQNMQFLKKLILYGCLKITNESLKALADSQILESRKIEDLNIYTGIRYLDLRSTLIDDRGVQYITSAMNNNFVYLEYLDLSMNMESITDKTLEFIKASQKMYRLKTLKIATCKITDKGITHLIHSECLTNLETLDISNEMDMQHYNKITDQALYLLASSSSNIERLKHLNVRASFVTSAGFNKFLTSENCAHLQSIRATFCNGINYQFLMDVSDARKRFLKSIKKISINDTQIQKEDIKEFVQDNPDVELIYSYQIDITEGQKKDEQQNKLQSQKSKQYY